MPAIISISLIIFLLPVRLFAYLDPGTGSFVFQILIASVLTGLYIIKTYWKKIKFLFKKNKNDE
jgi:hypothetical protein